MNLPLNLDVNQKSAIKKNRGQWFFSVMSHRLYEIGLYKFVTTQLWRCPTELLLDHYRENVSDNHLEIGVGSGYFLKRTLVQKRKQRLVLLDLNDHCLAKSAQHLQAFSPRLRRHNVLQPLSLAGGAVASIGMNYVLHCIGGSFKTNWRLFAHLASVLEEGGVLFGATLVERPASEGVGAWLLMKTLNLLGIFNNTEQRMADLKQALEASFSTVSIQRSGNALVFRAVR